MVSVRRPIRLLLHIAALVVACGLLQTATAQAANEWDIDTSFNGGISSIDLSQFVIAGPNNSDVFQDVAVDSSGRVVAVGTVTDAGGDHMIVARYNSSGGLDTTFDTDGIAIFNGAAAYTVAIQTDGKIVVGGSLDFGTNDDMIIVRFKSDGSLDTSSFNSPSGYATWNAGGGNDVGYGVAINPGNGEIWLAGSSGGGKQAMFVVTSTGGLVAQWEDDLSSMEGGPAAPSGANDITWDQSTSSFFTAGFEGTNKQFAVARYSAGTHGLLLAFGGNGVANFGDANNETAFAITTTSSRVLVAGVRTTTNDDVLVAALKPSDGSVDTTWNTTGTPGSTLTVVGPNIETVGEIRLDSSGRLVVAGMSQATNKQLMLLRYMNSGGLDLSWNSTGIVVTPPPTGGLDTLRADAMTIDTNGRIVAVGRSVTASGTDAMIVRYLGSPPAGSTTVDLSGCNGPAVDFGTITPGVPAVTTDCLLTYSTTNPTGLSLTIEQQDHIGTAMQPDGVIRDYATGSNSFSAGPSMFGACLHNIAGVAGVTATWTVAGGGNCPPADGAFWRPVPQVPDEILRSTMAVTSATANLQFGVKANSTIQAGTYMAPITIRVVANP